MVNDDVLFHFRLRLFSLAGELGNVRAACRTFGVHPSTYYRWRGPVLRSGLEMLRPRERRPPRMPNQTSALTEQRVLAFSLGHPGYGPRRVAASLGQVRWGGIVISAKASGACSAGMASIGASAACRSSPAMPRHLNLSGHHRSPRAMSRSADRASWSASTASTSAG